MSVVDDVYQAALDGEKVVVLCARHNDPVSWVDRVAGQARGMAGVERLVRSAAHPRLEFRSGGSVRAVVYGPAMRGLSADLVVLDVPEGMRDQATRTAQPITATSPTGRITHAPADSP